MTSCYKLRQQEGNGFHRLLEEWNATYEAEGTAGEIKLATENASINLGVLI